jgi:hypothetical protein
MKVPFLIGPDSYCNFAARQSLDNQHSLQGAFRGSISWNRATAKRTNKNCALDSTWGGVLIRLGGQEDGCR